MDDFKQVLQTIVAKDITSLTEYDKAFLNARVSYLTGDQIAKFSSVLNTKQAESVSPAPEPEQAPEAPVQPQPVAETPQPQEAVPQAPIPQAPAKDPYDPDA